MRKQKNYLIMVLLLIIWQPTVAGGFKENLHYKRVSPIIMQADAQGEKIEVVEFFLYSCLHCFKLEPKLAAWVQSHKDEVSFKRVPAVITPSWVALAKAYYVAEKLGLLEKTHLALFKSIHEDKKLYLNEYQLAEFFEPYGVDTTVFLREFNAPDIVEKVSQARIQSVRYDFRGVPAIVVNDEFKTAPFYNKNQQQMLEVMDYLLTKIQKRK